MTSLAPGDRRFPSETTARNDLEAEILTDEAKRGTVERIERHAARRLRLRRRESTK
jgi:hypothetical protein